MLRMQAATNLTLREISQNIKKLENVIKKSTKFNLETNDVLIAEFLPLNTVERIKEFESLLKNTEEAVTQFKEYILKAGGNSPKANIQRILGKIFTNECAMNCFMKGIQNNFRVGDLYLMKIVRSM
ncbi:uncharacterized protein LOC105840152 [Monomorium pharaonis]|uniref:uncharacterized protein LOC105840152 n=1 Tax=Monomorium pharaonis TaxID=307658 RepID=UPI00102E10D5|nr:uncharacterized protein LOC105840152 [Monomorium pharaonis]XP_036144672.1 uncharacterized protein LOC105840152 [Monomorium pharaonis]XP_036144673.1 uncharacterized protein LOC105840152 [Monomorium pharaonis]XP_036144674.1 uncharacterized protein LOC105840152 [Monomorium pharaonis]